LPVAAGRAVNLPVAKLQQAVGRPLRVGAILDDVQDRHDGEIRIHLRHAAGWRLDSAIHGGELRAADSRREESVRVGPSSHGLGVFSLRLFTTGEFIGPIQGEIVDDPEYSSDYCMELGERSLEPSPPFRYLNHSCQPNCALVVCDEDDQHKATGSLSLWLEILREIAPGEQITIDYAWPADAAIPCQCGTETCRGWIVAEKGLDEVVSAQQRSLVAN
jgi:hypothetical protein